MLRNFARISTSAARQTAMAAGPAKIAVARSPVFYRFNSTKASTEGEKKETEEQAKKDGEAEAADAAEGKAEQGEPSELEQIKEKLLKKDKEAAEFKNLYMRSVADFRNLQEVTKRDVQKAKDFALQKFAKDLLESIDNFGHVLNAIKPETIEQHKEVKDLFEGIKMTKDIFEKTLAKHGLERIDPMDKPFDPNLHEATFEVPQAGKEPGSVFFVQQDGYTLNKRVLRPAKVGVVKGEE